MRVSGAFGAVWGGVGEATGLDCDVDSLGIELGSLDPRGLIGGGFFDAMMSNTPCEALCDTGGVGNWGALGDERVGGVGSGLTAEPLGEVKLKKKNQKN